jgi:hypothetical protein
MTSPRWFFADRRHLGNVLEPLFIATLDIAAELIHQLFPANH